MGYLKHFPHYKQHNASDCGPTSLRMIDSTLESKSFCRMLWHWEHKHGGYKSPFTTAFLAAKVVSDEPFATRKALLSSVEHGGHKP